jgi:predicted DsbA family dithiol-disulfide isomerase
MVGMFKSYFTQRRDPSARETHLVVAEETGFDPALFAAALDSEPVDRALQKDLDWAETLGIRGFPSLVLSVKDKYFLIAPGCQPIETLRKSINAVYEAHGIELMRPESGLYS